MSLNSFWQGDLSTMTFDVIFIWPNSDNISDDHLTMLILFYLCSGVETGYRYLWSVRTIEITETQKSRKL